MVAAHSRVNQGWLFGFSWNSFRVIKLPISVRIHSDTRAAVLGEVFVKKTEMLSLCKIWSCSCLFSCTKNRSVERSIRGCFGLASTLIREWSEVPESGGANFCEAFFRAVCEGEIDEVRLMSCHTRNVGGFFDNLL